MQGKQKSLLAYSAARVRFEAITSGNNRTDDELATTVVGNKRTVNEGNESSWKIAAGLFRVRSVPVAAIAKVATK